MIAELLPLFLKGAWVTLQITAFSLIGGLSLGIILGILSTQRGGLSPFIRAYIYVVRGTPLFVQLLLLYYALPQVTGMELSPMFCGVLGLSVHSSASIAELTRGGIQGISRGQWEAAYILGYHPITFWFRILLPQLMKVLLPAFTNEMITLLKESSLLLAIGVVELTKIAKDAVARHLLPLEIYLLVALIYLVLSSLLSILAQLVERRFQYANS
jgi:polar amino acid transport system permease protein